MIRGGAGNATRGSSTRWRIQSGLRTRSACSRANDGRPDFAVNPWNGPLPRAEDLEQSFCNVNFEAGCIRRALGQTIAPPNAENPYSYQASIGLQRQIGDTMGVTVDYSYNGTRKDRFRTTTST